MPNLRLIKRRIKSAKNVSQITYAMEMVAASKMKRAQTAALSGRPYAEKIAEAVSEFAGTAGRALHPLLAVHSEGDTFVILITTNKGLCGGLNVNLFKYLNSHVSNLNSHIAYITVGKKGETYLSKTRRHIVADFSDTSLIQIASALTQLVTQSYLNHQAKEIYLAYNRFVSSLKQEPTVKKVLPVESLSAKATSAQILVEPSPEAVFDSLLSAYIQNQILDALRQSVASEYSARMVTMKAATDSARDFIGSLTLEYNKARQEKVTAEISDIITARLSVS